MDHQSLSALAVFVPQSHCLLASFLLFFFLLYIWGCLLIEVAYLLCVWNNGVLLRQCGVCICEPAGQGSASCEQNRMKQPQTLCSVLLCYSLLKVAKETDPPVVACVIS